jgi:hypothetical protein
MMNAIVGKMDKLIIHFVGNKNNGDGVRFSDELTDYGNTEEYVKKLIGNSFKSEELFQFFFSPDLELNPIYQFIKSVFLDKKAFIEQSQNVARYLYDKSTHPQIKPGELCMAYFKDCQLNDKTVDCIGIFKSENKETVLKIDTIKNGYCLTGVKGININKLDKGCLIFNTDKESGYIVSVVDNTNKGYEAQYWKDNFLGVRPVNNGYHQTNQFLGITKQFVTKQFADDFELSKADQIDILNRSVNYFKTNEKFDKSDFENEVFQDESVIDSFRNFDNSYRRENKVELSDNFEISSQAVKKQARVFKSVLKLDENFHIYIHGNRNLIEQGVDENGRKYYKIFYQEES